MQSVATLRADEGRRPDRASGVAPSACALSTGRLKLRPLGMADAAAAHEEFDAHPEVWAYDPGHAFTRAEREAWVRNKVCEWATPTGHMGIGCYALVPAGGSRMIGCAGLAASLVPGGLDEATGGCASLEVELYFRLGRGHWGAGYATEACFALVRFAFESLRVRRVFCATWRGHERALAVMGRLGMQIDTAAPPGAFWGPDPARGMLWNPVAAVPCVADCTKAEGRID